MTQAQDLTPIVVVLGMHRSGTSVGMSVLSALGVACGEDLIPAGRSNPAGFWEHAEIVAVQERLLARLDRVWHGSHGTFPLPEGWLESDAARDAEEDLARIVAREVAAQPGRVWGFKDPRTMRLWSLWERIWSKLGLVPQPVIMVRHPDAVTRSLKTHNGLAPARGQLVWLQHNLEALRYVGDSLRLVVDFDLLVNNPTAEVDRIAAALSDLIEISETAKQAAVDKVSGKLRTHKAALVPPANAMAAEVYGALLALALGQGDAQHTQAIVDRYDAAAELFDSWRSDRRNVLTDWIVRFLVSRSGG